MQGLLPTGSLLQGQQVHIFPPAGQEPAFLPARQEPQAGLQVLAGRVLQEGRRPVQRKARGSKVWNPGQSAGWTQEAIIPSGWKLSWLQQSGCCTVPGQSCEPKHGRGPADGCYRRSAAAAWLEVRGAEKPAAELGDKAATANADEHATKSANEDAAEPANDDANDDDAERPERVPPVSAGRGGLRPVSSTKDGKEGRRKRRSRKKRKRRIRRRKTRKSKEKLQGDVNSSSSQEAGSQGTSSQATDPKWPSSPPAEEGKQSQPSVANIRIFTNNCRGYTSKKESIVKYEIEQIKLDVINLEETMMRNKAKINHKEYFSFSMNRPI